ncbi:uncharacterized protein LOC118412650 [Branchiostoma floridae]|uniref:Uncharacterized protein LOC118412650 n=1 Tax=Branchiostoma floridae TaxID=7739 RepID=A0A9J7KW41_BRAFL|nr:uncharacterized protein LOC118412650 [Branchiostoma floridae]
MQSVLEQLQAEMLHLQTEVGTKEQMFLSEIQHLQADDQAMQAEMQQLQHDTTAKDQMYQAEIQQLHTEMARKDQRIQDLEQRDYIERCESGDLTIPNGVLTYGAGARHRDMTASFSRAFRTTPVVTVGLTQLDHYAGETRVTASVVSVSTTGLTVRIGTWASSQLYNAYAHWMACA